MKGVKAPPPKNLTFMPLGFMLSVMGINASDPVIVIAGRRGYCCRSMGQMVGTCAEG